MGDIATGEFELQEDFWPDLSVPDDLWPDLSLPDWPNITAPEWPNLSLPSGFWPDLQIPDDIWPNLSVPDSLWPNISAPDWPNITAPEWPNLSLPSEFWPDLSVPDDLWPDLNPPSSGIWGALNPDSSGEPADIDQSPVEDSTVTSTTTPSSITVDGRDVPIEESTVSEQWNQPDGWKSMSRAKREQYLLNKTVGQQSAHSSDRQRDPSVATQPRVDIGEVRAVIDGRGLADSLDQALKSHRDEIRDEILEKISHEINRR
ncbi:hypothetical protein [Halobacterium salinarum]